MYHLTQAATVKILLLLTTIFHSKMPYIIIRMINGKIMSMMQSTSPTEAKSYLSKFLIDSKLMMVEMKLL